MALEEEVRIQSKGLEKEKKLQQSKLNGLLLDKAEALGLQGNVAVSYLIYLLGEGKNTAAQSIERYGKAGLASLRPWKKIWKFSGHIYTLRLQII